MLKQQVHIIYKLLTRFVAGGLAFFLMMLAGYYQGVASDAHLQTDYDLVVVCDSANLGFAVGAIHVFEYMAHKQVKVLLENTPAGQFRALAKGEAQLVIRPTRHVVMPDSVIFTEPLFTSHLVLMQRDSTPRIENHYDLEGCEIVIPADYSLSMRLGHLSDELNVPLDVRMIPQRSEAEVIHLLSEGRVDYALCSYIDARVYRKRYPNLQIGIDMGFAQNYCWVVAPDNDALVDELNVFLRTFVHSKEFRSLFATYYPLMD